LRTLCGNDRHVTPFRWKLVPSTIVYEKTVAERTIARGTTLVKPLRRAAAHLAPLLRERARTRRRPRRRARARRRDPTALVRRSRPPRGDARRATDERARRADPVQQERLHPRRRPDGGSRPRPARPPEERPPLDPRPSYGRGAQDHGASPPPPSAWNRAALLSPPDGCRHQDAHARAREDQRPCAPASSRAHPQLVAAV